MRASARRVTSDGLEATFATNHVAPFLLTRLLVEPHSGRKLAVCLVSSSQHRRVRAIPWDDLQGERGFNGLRVYQQTKLYNVLFASELARRHPLLRVCTVDPGFVRTALGREATGAFRALLWLTRPIQRTPDDPAREIADALLDPSAVGYCEPGGKPAEPSELARDVGVARRLWDVTRALCETRA